LRIVLQRPSKFLVRIPPIAQFEFGNAQLVIKRAILTGDVQGSLIISGCTLIIAVNAARSPFSSSILTFSSWSVLAASEMGSVHPFEAAQIRMVVAAIIISLS